MRLAKCDCSQTQQKGFSHTHKNILVLVKISNGSLKKSLIRVIRKQKIAQMQVFKRTRDQPEATLYVMTHIYKIAGAAESILAYW